jgi:hypothetical protein
MQQEQYLKLIADGEFALSVGDRVEYNCPRPCSTGEIIDVLGLRYLILFDDGTQLWRSRDKITFIPSEERIHNLAKHYRETNHERGNGPEFRLGNIREVSARLHRR